MSIFIDFIRARQPSYRGTRANKEATRSRGGDKGEAQIPSQKLGLDNLALGFVDELPICTP